MKLRRCWHSAAVALLFLGVSLVGPRVAFADSAKPKASAQRVLFIGNSYTYFNNLPAVLGQLANGAQPGSLETKMVVDGGATLKSLWEQGDALKAIQEGGWTWVVLQEQSTLGQGPRVDGIPQINDPAAFYNYARHFDAEIKKSGAKTAFYLTWSRQDSPQSQAKLTAAYSSIATELSAVLVPVGTAWQVVVHEKPQLALYQTDKSHPTPAGTYLAACTFYATLFKRNPAGLPSHLVGSPVDMGGKVFDAQSGTVSSSPSQAELVNLTPEDAHYLQTIAWQSVQNHDARAKSSSLFDDSNHFITQGHYLAALQLMRGTVAPAEESARLQMSSWFLNAAGQYSEAQKMFNESGGKARDLLPTPTAEELSAIRSVPLMPAEDMVLRAVKEHQVVILNEAHHQPEHRAFGARLMPRLAALGVKFVAIESGDQESLDAAAKSGQVKTDTDIYSWDPQRAALLRASIRAGIKLVAIDVLPKDQGGMQRESDRIAFRETAMARQLQELVDRAHGAKVLVWVGFSHALKTPQGKRGIEWMAARFWKATKIEPYSIYQMSDEGDLPFDDPIYQLVSTAATASPQQPVAIRLPVSSFELKMPHAVTEHPLYSRLARLGADAVVLHPRKQVTSATARPDWLNGTSEIFGKVTCGRATCAGYLVQALPVEAGNSDLTNPPTDQVMTSGNGEYLLRVPSGVSQLRVAALDATGNRDDLVATIPAANYKAHERNRCDIRLNEATSGRGRPAALVAPATSFAHHTRKQRL